MQVVLLTAVLALGLNLHVINAWRRRRRVSQVRGAKELETRKKRDLLSDGRKCSIHGEYSLKRGKVVPTDNTGSTVTGLKCNKDFCWKGHYCWQCKLRSGGLEFREVMPSQINKIICKDAQCLVGKKDTSLEYYSRNDSRSVPRANGPFSCNSYLCMSDKDCWKCRLNHENDDFETVNTGREFDNRVTCCPIPTRLVQLQGRSFGGLKSGSSLDDDEEKELENDGSFILANLPARKLITNIEVTHRGRKSPVQYTFSYSLDGETWLEYHEFQDKAVSYTKILANWQPKVIFDKVTFSVFYCI
eukprot:gene4902-21235_t